MEKEKKYWGNSETFNIILKIIGIMVLLLAILSLIRSCSECTYRATIVNKTGYLPDNENWDNIPDVQPPYDDDDTLNFMETTEFRFDDWTTAYPGKSFAQKLKEHSKKIIVGQDLGTVQSMADNVLNDPDRYSAWVPEYGTDYKYNWNFVNSMYGKVISRLENNGYEGVKIATHDYYALVNLYNSRN